MFTSDLVWGKNFFPVPLNTVYLDSAATTQIPQIVISEMDEYFHHHNANIKRGTYNLAVEATNIYEKARKCVKDFIKASHNEEIIFVRNTTEALNLVAYSWGLHNLGPEDEILISIVEHHSNTLPWRMVASKTGATIRYIYCERDGAITEDWFKQNITKKTKLVCMTHLSNVFGRIYDLKKFAEISHEAGAIFVADGAQAVGHIPVDVRDIDVDFYAFSGHKMYGPMGIGVLYGKKSLLSSMDPFLLGGDMIDYVSCNSVEWAGLPEKFEAGTPNVAGAIGLYAAIDVIKSIGQDFISEYEDYLVETAMHEMRKIDHVRILGSPDPKEHKGIISFNVDDVHPHDVVAIFDDEDICLRAGYHCAQPLHEYLNEHGSVRMSVAYYNNYDDIKRFLEVLGSVRGRMGRN